MVIFPSKLDKALRNVILNTKRVIQCERKKKGIYIYIVLVRLSRAYWVVINSIGVT